MKSEIVRVPVEYGDVEGCGVVSGVVGEPQPVLSGVRPDSLLDNDGDEGAETPRERSCFFCSDFCFFNNLSASISARLCSLASKLPFLVEAPAGKAENHDMNF